MASRSPATCCARRDTPRAEAAPLLRNHAKVLIVGACLLALGAGFAMIPAASAGGGSAILRVIAAVAVVAATALVLPT